MTLPLPPGKLGLPFLGESLDFFSDPDFASKRYDRYGPIFKTNLLGRKTVFLKGAEANRFVLSNENTLFRTSGPPSLKALLGPLSLTLQTGGVHAQRRRLLAQAFQPRALASYVPAMAEMTEAYLHRWLTQGDLTWYPELRRYTFDVAGKLLVGLDNAANLPLGHDFEIWSQGLFSIPLNLPVTSFGRAMAARKRLLNGIRTVIEGRMHSGTDVSQDALGLLLQARDETTGEGLSLEELKDQVLLLLFAGHETLTSGIAAFCLLLAQHPEVCEQARAEQLPWRGQPVTAEQLRETPYLDQVLKETLRLIPPVGGGFRTVLQDCEFNGYRIPQGWLVQYNISLSLKDSNVYNHPERFDPERFAPDRAEDKGKPFSYVPFGGGLRECLGKEFARLEMKLFAALLLRRCQWMLEPGQDLSLIVVPTPQPRDQLRVHLEPLGSEPLTVAGVAENSPGRAV
jgi:cytochrome P450